MLIRSKEVMFLQQKFHIAEQVHDLKYAFFAPQNMMLLVC